MLFSVIGIALVTVCICILLQKWNPEISMMASLICGVIIFSLVIVNLTPVLDTIGNLVNGIEIQTEYIAIVIKALGICYITQLASDTCRDSGYTAIASKVELAGKVSVLVISLPLFTNLMNIALNLINLGT